MTTAGLPWNYKVIYGVMSDTLPIGGSNRRSYIALAGFLGIAGFIGLYFVSLGDLGPDQVQAVTVLLLLTNLSTAFCDVCCDALVATNAKMESEAGAGNLQSLCWMMLGVGGAISRLGAGQLYEA